MDIHVELHMWRFRGADFMVEVSRHTNRDVLKALEGHIPSEFMTAIQPENNWCIYAYLYPQHPAFGKIESDSLIDPVARSFPFHGGCTYNRWYSDFANMLYKKIGCDYNHIEDGRFSHYSTREEAWEVFKDAEELVNFLKDYK